MTDTDTDTDKDTVSVLLSMFFGGLLLIAMFWLPRHKKVKGELEYPPHPEPCHFLWGNAKEFRRISEGLHIDPIMLKWAKELGPVFNMKVPVVGNMICVADPELIKYITITKNYNKSWTYKANTPLLGDRAIVLVHGEEWKRHRKTFAPGFTTTFLKDMVSVMCDKLDRFTACIDQDILTLQQPTNMMDRAQTFTSDVIVQIAFGEDWGGDEPHDARAYITELTDLLVAFDQNIFLKFFGFAARRRIKELETKLDQVLLHVLDQRVKQLKEEEKQNSTNEGRTYSNVCTLAIDSMLKERPDGVLTEEDRTVILHQLKTFYFAGHDTTATTISWAVWLLSQHPEKLQKLRTELKERNIFNTPDQRPTYAQLQDCEYLDAVIKESLRLYPPAASARYVADPQESWNGMKLGGAVLYVNCYVTHRLPLYWDRPDDFWPERFVGVPSEEYAHKFIPFLKGPRDCLGKYFALLEAKLGVAALAQRYDMTCVDPNEIIGYRLTAYPRGGARVQMAMRK
jgi:cytochrome P450